MTGAIDWHPLGTPGPWFSDGRLPGTSTYAVFHEQGVACVALCQAGCLAANGRDDAVKTNARAIAEVPAMVAALIQYRDDMRHLPIVDSRERRITMIEGILSRIEGKRA